MKKNKKIKAKKIRENDTVVLPNIGKALVSLALYFKERKQMWVKYNLADSNEHNEVLLEKDETVELVDRMEKFNERKARKEGIVDYAPPKGYVPDYDPSELPPSDDKSEKSKDEFFMFGEIDTREIINQPTKTAKEVEEALTKKVAETTRGDEEKIKKIVDETMPKKEV